MGENAIRENFGGEADGSQRRGAGDETIDDDRGAGPRRAQNRAGHHGDLEAAELGEHGKRVGGAAAGGGARQRGLLTLEAGLVMPGAKTDTGFERSGGEAMHDQRG